MRKAGRKRRGEGGREDEEERKRQEGKLKRAVPRPMRKSGVQQSPVRWRAGVPAPSPRRLSPSLNPLTVSQPCVSPHYVCRAGGRWEGGSDPQSTQPGGELTHTCSTHVHAHTLIHTHVAHTCTHIHEYTHMNTHINTHT